MVVSSIRGIVIVTRVPLLLLVYIADRAASKMRLEPLLDIADAVAQRRVRRFIMERPVDGLVVYGRKPLSSMTIRHCPLPDGLKSG